MKSEEIPDFSLMVMENALIESTTIGREHHGGLSFFLNLKMDGSVQGFGRYILCNENDPSSPLTSVAIMSILSVVGTSNWENLPGKYVRTIRSKFLSPIVGIGHVYEDRWFCPESAFELYEKSMSQHFHVEKFIRLAGEVIKHVEDAHQDIEWRLENMKKELKSIESK